MRWRRLLTSASSRPASISRFEIVWGSIISIEAASYEQIARGDLNYIWEAAAAGAEIDDRPDAGTEDE